MPIRIKPRDELAARVQPLKDHVTADVLQPPVMDTVWTACAVRVEELQELTAKDPDISYRTCIEILARLNLKHRS